MSKTFASSSSCFTTNPRPDDGRKKLPFSRAVRRDPLSAFPPLLPSTFPFPDGIVWVSSDLQIEDEERLMEMFAGGVNYDPSIRAARVPVPVESERQSERGETRRETAARRETEIGASESVAFYL